MCDCHNSDAEHEVAMANTNLLNGLRGLAQYAPPSDEAFENIRDFIRQMFALPDVEQALCDSYGDQIADAIEVLGERGKL